jgi:hypothetical protein
MMRNQQLIKMKPPSNPHSTRCAKCSSVIIKTNHRVMWWIQIKNNVYCKKCYDKRKRKTKI